MRLKFNIFLFSIFTLLFTDCADDLLREGNINVGNLGNLGEGYELPIKIDDCILRTRDVNFQEGASLRLNKVWLGVFDVNTGACVSNNTFSMDYIPITSGQYRTGVIRVDLDAPPAETNENDEFIMVCVANFNGVLVGNHDDVLNGDSTDEDYLTLEYQLDHVENWNGFNKLSVDFATAYAAPHNSDTPVLAGFLYDNDYYGDISNEMKDEKPHVKIDQFKSGDGVSLSPLNLINSLKFKFDKNTNTYYTGESSKSINDSKAIFLRRLVANINVNISVTDPNLQLTQVYYRRMNVPSSAYIIERKTTDCEVDENNGAVTKKGNFPTDPQHSPNYGDLNPSTGYFSDGEDSWNVTANPNHFSFQHLANKHWAAYPQPTGNNYQTLKDDNGNEIEREKLNDNLAFKALVGENGNPTDFNNYASYFIIKMHLIDLSKGRALEAEYTIHEGNTSDELGVGMGYDQNGDPIGNAWDFVTARNINYTYNVVINGVNNIYHNVEKDGHFSGQGGNVWKIVYANDPKDENGNPLESNDPLTSIQGKCYYDGDTGDFINAVPSTGGVYENAIIINCKNPNLAFRLYGYNTDPEDQSQRHIEGYNYNFTQDSFSYLTSIWPPSAAIYSHYFKDYDSLFDETSEDQIPNCLREGLKIIEEGTTTELNIIEFVERVGDLKREANGNDLIKSFSIKINKTEINDLIRSIPESEKNNYVRAIYIADRNGEYDEDGCSRLVTIYAAAQYPDYYETFNAVPVFKNEMYQDWRNIWNSKWPTLTDYEHRIHYAQTFSTSGDTWRGTIDGVVDLAYRIVKDLGQTKYKIEILNESGSNLKTVTFDRNDLVPQDNYYIFPFNTNGLTPGNYDVKLSLADLEEGENTGNVPIVSKGKLALYNKSWSFGDAFWQNNFIYTTGNLANSMFNVSGETVSHGGKPYSKEKNFFIEYNGFELGVFELSETSPFIQTTNNGRLYTIADFHPDNSTDGESNPDWQNQPTQGNSFQMKFNTTKNGSVKVEIENSNTTVANGKTMKIYLGDNLQGSTSGLPSGASYNASTNIYTYTPYPVTKTTLSFQVIVKDTNKTEGCDITIGIVKDVGYIYSVKFE